MAVTVKRHRQPILLNVAIQGLHVTHRAFLGYKAQLGQPAGGIVDEYQQTATRTALFEPGVIAAIDLNQFTEAGPPLAQGINMRLGTTLRPPQLGGDHDLTNSFLG